MKAIADHVFTLSGGAAATTAKPAGKKKADAPIPGRKRAQN
jgi:hypothetical protein